MCDDAWITQATAFKLAMISQPISARDWIPSEDGSPSAEIKVRATEPSRESIPQIDSFPLSTYAPASRASGAHSFPWMVLLGIGK